MKGNKDGYLWEWSNWFSSLPEEEKEKYKEKYPELKKWTEIYDNIA